MCENNSGLNFVMLGYIYIAVENKRSKPLLTFLFFISFVMLSYIYIAVENKRDNL